MYAVHRQAHTPTAVEFSVYCNFISSKEKNLVVAGTSQLFVYRIIHDVEVDIPSSSLCQVLKYKHKKASCDKCNTYVIVSEYIKGGQVLRYVQTSYSKCILCYRYITEILMSAFVVRFFSFLLL